MRRKICGALLFEGINSFTIIIYYIRIKIKFGEKGLWATDCKNL